MDLPTNRTAAVAADRHLLAKQARGMGVGLLTLLVLGGCSWLGNGPGRQADRDRQAQERAEQQHQQKLVQACRGSQAAVRRLSAQLQTNATALTQLAGRRYSPLPRPQRASDAVLQRYTISDQELELERHQQALQTWRARESWRRGSWLKEQASERGRLEEQRRQLRLQLAELQPTAVGPAPEREPRAAALAAYSSCDPQVLANLRTQPVESATTRPATSRPVRSKPSNP